MEMTVVSLRDNVSGLFGRPIFTHSDKVAVRSLSDEVNRPDGTDDLHRHPEDFDLYLIGSFDDQSGLLTSVLPVLLCKASACVKKEVHHVS